MAEVITMPKLGFDMAEGKLVRWVKAEGEPVTRGEVLAEIETDKATVEVESTAAGLVHKHLVPEGTSVPVGTPIAVVAAQSEQVDLAGLTGGAAPQPAAAPAATAPPASAKKAAGTVTPEAEPQGGRLPGGVRASPLARRLAQARGLDLRGVSGSGPGGRVTRRDVEQAGGGRAAPGVTEEIPLTKLRAIIGRRMAQAKQQIPHFYVTIDVDAAPLMGMRQELNALQPEAEKASVNDFIVKASALALRDMPALNASLDGERIVRHGQVNVGVAVAVDDGLLTVVVRQADAKSVREIAAELRELVSRARQGRVRPADIEGSTFSVSNLGMFEVDHFIAIVNPPEAAILAVGSVRQEPVVVDGQVVVGQRLRLTVSADHRVTDGAEAARWLQVLRGYMEHPLRLIL